MSEAKYLNVDNWSDVTIIGNKGNGRKYSPCWVISGRVCESKDYYTMGYVLGGNKKGIFLGDLPLTRTVMQMNKLTVVKQFNDDEIKKAMDVVEYFSNNKDLRSRKIDISYHKDFLGVE